MLLLALRIVAKTLFDSKFDDEVHEFAAAVDSFQGFLPLAFLPFPELIQKLPIPAMTKIRRARKLLDELIYRMIAERRAAPGDRGDLLSMLLGSVDEDGGRMSDQQVRDECLTILLAGHETTANALSFAAWLLAENPSVQEELAVECRTVLGGRAPAAADYPRLGYAERVFAEAMRLYPPVWVTARTAAEAYDYRGFRIEKGTILVAPQFAVQRDSRRKRRRRGRSSPTFRLGAAAGSVSERGWRGWRVPCRWRRCARSGAFCRDWRRAERCRSILRFRCGRKGRCR
jgi:cytochrome P450